MKEWIQNERKANKKRYRNTGLCFIGMMIPALAMHSWLFCLLLVEIFYLAVPKKQKTEGYFFMPLHSQEQRNLALLKSVAVPGVMAVILFASLLWCCYVENEFMLNGLAVKYSALVTFTFFVTASEGILLEENAGNRGVTGSFYLKHCCAVWYRVLHIGAVALHIGIGGFSVLLGSVFWVEKGVVFNNPVLENSILALCFIPLLVCYMVSVRVLLRTLGMGDYCIKVYSKEVGMHESKYSVQKQCTHL